MLLVRDVVRIVSITLAEINLEISRGERKSERVKEPSWQKWNHSLILKPLLASLDGAVLIDFCVPIAFFYSFFFFLLFFSFVLSLSLTLSLSLSLSLFFFLSFSLSLLFFLRWFCWCFFCSYVLLPSLLFLFLLRFILLLILRSVLSRCRSRTSDQFARVGCPGEQKWPFCLCAIFYLENLLLSLVVFLRRVCKGREGVILNTKKKFAHELTD